MKYKALYSVLEKRMAEVSGFQYDDRSCWPLTCPTYVDRLHSLWIIAVDPATRRRIWITHDGGSDFRISFKSIDEQMNNYGPIRDIRCTSRMDLASKLQKLFSEPNTFVD